ncbi:RING-H2 finger protein ATL57 [Linum perenne]
MKTHFRKLRFTQSDVGFVGSVLVTAGGGGGVAGDTEPGMLLIHPPVTSPEKLDYEQHPSIDSSMALTILVLLTALFFMGFFSIYIRRFASDTAAAEAGYYRRRRVVGSGIKGVDPEVVGSLPVFRYRRGGKCTPPPSAAAECVICLGEFEEEERVKVIPFCGHVFHVECVDTWLLSHVSCPLCRGTQFVQVVVDRGSAMEVERRSTVDGVDTWSGGLRRICSSSSLERKDGERVLIVRTLSF